MEKTFKKYYTIFQGEKLFENVIDDMNEGKDWAWGGMLWKDKEKAIECLKYYQSTNKEFRTEDYDSCRVVEVYVKI